MLIFRKILRAYQTDDPIFHSHAFSLINASYHTAQKMMFCIKDFQETADLVTFTEKFLMENFIFCAMSVGLLTLVLTSLTVTKTKV